MPPVGHDRAAAKRTAAAAALAGLPAAAATVAAAASADALAVRADLLLTLIDGVVLGAVWWAARRPARDPEHLAAVEARTLVCVGVSMALSLLLVATLAIARLTGDAARPEGAGLWLALAQNGAYALINGWILWRWRQRMRGAPTALVRAQLRLFADKLTSNLLLTAALCGTLALQDAAHAIAVDAVAGVLLAALSAWWYAPVLAQTWQRLCRGPVRLLQDAA